ncbi:hypothetical protein DXB87_03505 [Phocaeicola plebeius]|uniref:Uncharacterized protein n=1 Tax=Phocaeicola plebeius TaxID=310297 RepID=A0A3E4ZDF4_9BACT|nr:hypothetical protein DXB87_03505 [Phocaeicola plebeius]
MNKFLFIQMLLYLYFIPLVGILRKKECFKNFLWWLTEKECLLIRELAQCTITIVNGIIY